jgi:hypothetical protein
VCSEYALTNSKYPLILISKGITTYVRNLSSYLSEVFILLLFTESIVNLEAEFMCLINLIMSTSQSHFVMNFYSIVMDVFCI